MNSNNNIKIISIVVFVLFVAIFASILIINIGGESDEATEMTADSEQEVTTAAMTKEEAEEEIANMAESVKASNAELIKASVDLSESSLASEVPSIDEYPLSVRGSGDKRKLG